MEGENCDCSFEYISFFMLFHSQFLYFLLRFPFLFNFLNYIALCHTFPLSVNEYRKTYSASKSVSQSVSQPVSETNTQPSRSNQPPSYPHPVAELNKSRKCKHTHPHMLARIHFIIIINLIPWHILRYYPIQVEILCKWCDLGCEWQW